MRNPNGMFNACRARGVFRSDEFVFNYDPLASVVLNAGDGVTITGNATARARRTMKG